MTFLISWCISEMSSSIKNEYLKFIVFSMRIFENDEKWVWNIIFTLFCTVMMMLKHSDFVSKKIVAWVNVFTIAFLAHFAIQNSFLENCLTFCMIFWYSLHFCFLIILLFLLHAWMYFTQSLMIWQFLLIHHMLLMISVHFFVYSALIISCDFTQKVKISMIFLNAFSNCFMYLFMRWCFIFWFNNDSDICSFKVLMNFSLFIVFQLQRDLRADSLQTLRFITVCIDKWSEKFFISSLISHHINLFVMLFVVKIKFIVV